MAAKKEIKRKQEEPIKKATTKKTTTTQKKKTTTVKNTLDGKNTKNRTSSSKKKSTPKTNASSANKKKNPSNSSQKKSTPSKQVTTKTKTKTVPKKDIKTSLDKPIEKQKEEPIKIITSSEKRKGKKATISKNRFQTITLNIKKAGSTFVQLVKQFLLKVAVFLKKLKPVKETESIAPVVKEKKKKAKNTFVSFFKQFSFKLVTFFKKIKPVKQEKTAKPKKETTPKTQVEKTKKKRGKWIVLIVILFAFVILMLLPYGANTYLSGASNKNLEAPKFMKLKEECCSYTATFSSPRSIMALKKDMETIIKEYKVLQCDNKTYYYNANENYTITEYSFKKGMLFNQLSITYGVGNSCDIDTKFKKLEVLPADFSIEDAKKDGNYVIEGDKVYNKEAYTNFIGNVNNKIAATLRIVTTNENNDVLITDVEYKNGKFLVSYDGTRDKNSKNNKSIIAYKFDHLIVSNGKLYVYNGDKLDTKKAKKYETYYLLDVIE